MMQLADRCLILLKNNSINYTVEKKDKRRQKKQYEYMNFISIYRFIIQNF
jgi:hypothetical protein